MQLASKDIEWKWADSLTVNLSVCWFEQKKKPNQIFMWAMGNRGATWQSQNAISFANHSKSVVLHTVFHCNGHTYYRGNIHVNWMARKFVHMCNFTHRLSKCPFSILNTRKMKQQHWNFLVVFDCVWNVANNIS